MKARDVLAVLFFVLTIYSFAGGTLLGAVNYPTWRSLNPAEFPRLHQAVNRPITLFYVTFFFLCVVLTILLVWFHPPAMSTVWVAVAAILNLFIWIVTVTLAIPIHKQLDHNKSVELIDKLIFYHVFESSPRPHSYARHGFVVPGGESVESRIGAVKADFIIARSYPSVGIRAALLAGYHGIVAGWLSLSCRIVLASGGTPNPLPLFTFGPLGRGRPWKESRFWATVSNAPSTCTLGGREEVRPTRKQRSEDAARNAVETSAGPARSASTAPASCCPLSTKEVGYFEICRFIRT